MQTTYAYQQVINTTTSSMNNSNNDALQHFVTPADMIKRLLQTQANSKCQCSGSPEAQQSSKGEIVMRIQQLQHQRNCIHQQIIESQNMLHIRDNLYQQLDYLKEQRAQIQSDIRQATIIEKNVHVKVKSGYKEMNQRLKRRIMQVKDYIQKMDMQNRKIEETIIYSTGALIQKNYRTQLRSTAWVDNSYYDHRPSNYRNLDDMMSRLHAKQEEAMNKVRRQQQEIDRRNAFTRNQKLASREYLDRSNGNVITSQNYGFDRSQSYGRRFYSPQYRY